MSEVKTLALVTRTLDPESREKDRLVLASCDEVFMIQGGVHNDPAKIREKGFSVPDKWSALDEDLKARRADTGAQAAGYAALIEAITRNDKVITL